MNPRRLAVAALLSAALLRCGGDAVNFDLDHPPPALRRLDSLLPAKVLQPNELSGNCIGVPFRSCQADVMRSRSLVRKARLALLDGQEVRVTYTPNERANEVTVTIRPNATVPVRKSGGTLRFDCTRPGMNGCTVTLQ